MSTTRAVARAQALRFVVLIGVVSLFSDMTYESARSINGSFLAVLGASAAVVGIVSGLGELLGYLVRLGSGWLSGRTGRYWLVTGLGYAVNLLAAPALALVGAWQVALLLIVLERVTSLRWVVAISVLAQLGAVLVLCTMVRRLPGRGAGRVGAPAPR